MQFNVFTLQLTEGKKNWTEEREKTVDTENENEDSSKETESLT